jgi:hypothetical protein
MHRSSESIGAIAAALAKAQAELTNPEKSLTATIAIPLATALRQSLIELSDSQQAANGQRTKMEMVYQYLTGPRFRSRIDVIVEKFTDMQSDLDRERKTMLRIWAKREEQLRSVLDSSAGLYGDLQGIAGRVLPEIDNLTFLMIENVPDRE